MGKCWEKQDETLENKINSVYEKFIKSVEKQVIFEFCHEIVKNIEKKEKTVKFKILIKMEDIS